MITQIKAKLIPQITITSRMNRWNHLKICEINAERARRAKRGQIAIGFLAVIALALVLVTMTVNVGQMAQVRVETSNAADAGALAGASWIASGMNEAALVADKITEAMVLVQAIYLVPFCPGAEQTSYANQLWYSLEEHPYASDPLLASPGYRRRGPAPYFKEVADDAMWAAWYVGSREWYTAAVNNLMIKFPTGAGTFCSSENWWECVGSHSNFGEVADKIVYEQKRMNKIGAGANPVPLTWNNSLPFDDPMNLTHTAPLDVKFPERAPRLILAEEAGVYHQYEPAHEISVAGVPEPVFTCTFDSWGIRTGYSGPNDPDALFVLMPESLLDYSINPLAMATGQDIDGDSVGDWGKLWDVTWRKSRPLGSNDLERLNNLNLTSPMNPYIPSLEHLDEISQEVNGRPAVGRCLKSNGEPQYVCETTLMHTDPLEPVGRSPNVRPDRFEGGSGSVSVAVGHKVEMADGSTPSMFSYTELPHLTPRFAGAASKAEATYSPPAFALPMTEAKAELEKTW